MTPKQAFDDIMARAARLMRLHDGLINTRKRKIRSDWKSTFCKLMHWPQKCEIERVDSVDAVVVLREGASLKQEDFSSDTMDDLLRSSLVYGVSALDRYVHERVCKGIVKAFSESELSTRQKEFSIPLELALKANEALRKAHKAGKQTRPANEFRKAVQEMLHSRPFQSWRDIEYAFALIGVSGITRKIQDSKRIGDKKPYKEKLSSIIERRHKVVHEGDLPRHQRGGVAKKVEIKRKFVVESIDYLEDLVSELEKI